MHHFHHVLGFADGHDGNNQIEQQDGPPQHVHAGLAGRGFTRHIYVKTYFRAVPRFCEELCLSAARQEQ